MDEENVKRRGYYSEIVTGTVEHAVKPEVVLLATAPRRTKLAWQVPTEHHSARIGQLQDQETYNILGEAKRWMSFPEDRSITFPAETFVPKVQMQQNVEPKRIPRNVEMERRRRLYRNLKVQDVLEEVGVSPKQMLPPSATLPLLTYEEKCGLFNTAHFLPLEIFDDEEYDCRTVEDWINLGVIDGTHYPLPATVFVPRFRSEDETFSLEDNQLNNLFAWTNAAVTHYDRERKLWTVLTLDGRKRKFKIPRIYIRLFAEDPRIYAKRVVAAIKHRRIAEASIKYREIDTE